MGQPAASSAGAMEVVAKCAGKNGFYAGTSYKQYWVRDLEYSAEMLIASGYADKVESHLKEILKRQKPSGEIPTRVQTPAEVFTEEFQTKVALQG